MAEERIFSRSDQFDLFTAQLWNGIGFSSGKDIADIHECCAAFLVAHLLDNYITVSHTKAPYRLTLVNVWSEIAA